MLVYLALVLASSGMQAPAYPSCDIAAQNALPGETGGTDTDVRQAHIAMRANILEADLGNARKARRLGRAEADTLFKRIETVRRHGAAFVRKQGFLSAAERASYDRELDAIAMQVCRG